MAKRKPKVGKTLFLVDTGNKTRHGRGKQRECTVTRVGRKYFYVKYGGWCEVKLSLKTWIEYSDYIADYAVYESEQEWKDACLAQKYREAIKEAFRYIAGIPIEITLHQLKQVAEILNITIEATKK